MSSSTGIVIGFGAVLDEAIFSKYIYKTPCAKARIIIVWLWISLGFLITISYKSVLLANMTSVDYEKGIDSIEDMLNSNKPLMVIRSMKVVVEDDPRPQVIKLSKMIKYYDFLNNRVPPKILNGYDVQ